MKKVMLSSKCCGDEFTWESFTLLATDNYPHPLGDS